MDFTITDEQQALAQAVRGILARNGSPAAEAGQAAAPPAHGPTLWAALVETGVPGLPWPEEDGGLGATYADLVVAAIELGRARLQVPLAETVVAGALVARLAPADLRAELLGGLTEGSVLPVPAVAEPMRAWGPAPADVTAREDGDGWRLHGTKAPVRFAPAATHLLVTAVTEAGTGVFLVAEPGAATEELDFDGTPAVLLGQGESADVALREALALGGVVLCAEALGAMEEALRLTTDYLNARVQFGVTLAHFQALTHRAADMYAQLELARSATLFAAMTADESPLDVDAVLRARVVVDKAGRLIGAEAIQMHGGIGVTAEHPVGHLTSRLVTIAHTWGDHRAHLAELGSRIADHEGIEVLS